MSEEKIVHITVGTAGHIDHGKSSIVKALTGTDPDRLKEEQERGMTIDLGYAGFTLPDGREIGLIDVPGHERFIKNMVAGATAIDLVMLIVAADDSVMPQTREHLEIMHLLGISHGLVLINKIDIVEDEFVDIVEEEVKSLVKETFLENAPIVRVSALTREGVDKLLETLYSLISNVTPRDDTAPFRMPVQRIFSAKGYGAVVTGVPVSGRISIGDSVEILPRGKSARVRGIQVYMKDVSSAYAGHRTALNLSDVDFHKLDRGDNVCSADSFSPSRFIEGKFTYLKSNKTSLKQKTQIRFHAGTSEIMGQMVLMDKKEIEPGEEAFVQYWLEAPVVVAPSDRCVIRRQSPMVTIGGGVILGNSERRLKPLKSFVVKNLEKKKKALNSPESYISCMLEERLTVPTERKDIKKFLPIKSERIEEIIDNLISEGAIKTLARGRLLIHREGIEKSEKHIVASLEAFYKKNPLKIYFEPSALIVATGVSEELLEESLNSLKQKKMLIDRQGKVALASREVALSREDQNLAAVIEDLFLREKFQAPAFGDMVERLKEYSIAKIKKVFDLLMEQGLLARLADNVFLHSEALQEAKNAVVAHFKSNPELTPADMKTMLGTSRKFAIPLLEYFDKINLTIRKGNHRVLKK
ncbi:MAG: selenocysteine-specific translation elongation factor [Planctomycetota bacterium]